MKNHLLKPLFFLIPFFFYHSARAQAVVHSKADSTLNTRAQNVYIELGGPGLLFSANYDTRFSQHRDGLGGRIGLGFIASGGASVVTVPVQLNYLLGKSDKYFEIGLGATYASFNSGSDFLSLNTNPVTANTVLGTMTFGYRYQPVDGGFNFRASFNPIFDSSNFVPYFGLSFGYTF
ncbi:hypothetical protein [Mucilaginibacter gotjawali]|uniref:Uncharacterized protein n=2 Tax=Mucilaginibacter gotjawali TaxID=1550579 RepID=A0A110B263_9SPHI|nr:hypothetical protein [Mucilaginibacter gotjawali]MBB3055549.1 hypothetical protein [Mucilaginibacter gotjawali]BAU53171.1 hypothetical protein MgSA37_01338 [Mucilaginibacter gotjawali]